jgi:hypothetical protein
MFMMALLVLLTPYIASTPSSLLFRTAKPVHVDVSWLAFARGEHC